MCFIKYFEVKFNDDVFVLPTEMLYYYSNLIKKHIDNTPLEKLVLDIDIEYLRKIINGDYRNYNLNIAKKLEMTIDFYESVIIKSNDINVTKNVLFFINENDICCQKKLNELIIEYSF